MKNICFFLIILVVLFLFYTYYEKRKEYKLTSSYNLLLKPIVPKQKYIIPKICYQTWKTKDLSDDIKMIIKHNKLLNMDIKFKLYDNHDIDSYIKKNFNHSIYSSFKKINPNYGAMKADFFRYCILYREGGIYLDIKSSFKCKLFGNIIKPNDICILDTKKYICNFIEWRDVLGYRTHEQWLLIFCKGHNYLKSMINIMVEAIDNYIEPPSFNMSRTFTTEITEAKEKVLRLTGPDAFTVAIHKSIIFSGIQHREVNYKLIAKLEHNKTVKNNIYSDIKKTHYSMLNEPLIRDIKEITYF